MSTSRLLSIPALIALTLLAAAPAPAFGQAGVDPIISDRAIVHVLPSADLASFIAAFELDHPGVHFNPEDALPGRRMHLLRVLFDDGPPDDLLLEQLAADLEANYLGFLYSGEFLYRNEAPEGKTGSAFVDGIAAAGYETQYARSRIGLAEAHARSTGAGVVIALLDTGVDATHPALAGRILPGGYNFVDDNTDVRDVGNGVDDDEDGDTDEMIGHGTFVAGLLAMVAPDAKILPIRVLEADGIGDGWLLTKGVAFAIDHGVEVINLSLSSTYDTATVEWLLGDETIDEAAGHGIVAVSAAGNQNRSDPREFPAMGRQGIGVAATDHEDVKAVFSNFSDRLRLCAPGESAAGIDPDRTIISTIPGGGYATWRGTSFAAPLVAGAAALIRSQHPTWLPNAGTAVAITSTLEVTAADVYPQNPQFAEDLELGAGRLDAGTATAVGPVAPALGDLDGDGIIGFSDLIKVLADWGLTHSIADLNGDGSVGFDDLLMLLSLWG